MSPVYVAYTVVGGVGLLSIIAAVVNWVYLGNIAARIAAVDDEIKRKSTEFDSLRRELAQAPRPDRRETEEEVDDSAFSGGDQNEESFDHEGLEIVRNVRPGFEASETPVQQHDTGPAPEFEAPPEPSVPEAPPAPCPAPPPPPPVSAQEPRADMTAQVSGTGHTILIPLFSKARKDADFLNAWRILAEKLPAISNPRVILDFSNVLFLYQKELEYLRRMKETVEHAGGSMSFANCQQELIYILQGIPSLAACLGGGDVA